MFALSTLFIGLIWPVSALVSSDISQFSSKNYDFIIVGAGTAGNVLANRLTEDSGTEVLVIEAGPTNENVELSTVPFFCPQMYPTSPWDWNYTTVPQAALDGRQVPYPRGRLLGGSSSTNFLVYTRGSAEDFDRFANFTEDPGWSWNALQPYIKKNEDFIKPADGHNTSGEFDRSAHGFSGPLRVSLPGFKQVIDDMILTAIQQLSSLFSFNQDMNSGFPLGIGWSPLTVNESAHRSSSATAYLAPQYLSRKNLDVLLETQVTRVLSSKGSNGTLLLNTVEMSKGRDSERVNMTAGKEVILSAGAINSPQILLLSGIGDSTELNDVGIQTVLDLPDVGKNLKDHALLPNQFLVNSTQTFERFANQTLFNEALDEFNSFGTGPFVDGPTDIIGWHRLPDNSSILQQYSDPSAGPHSSHYEMIFSNGFVAFVQDPPTTGSYMTITTNVISPMSVGSVRLTSSDPFDFPLIDPGLLNHPFDMGVMVEAIKSAKQFLTAPVWDNFVLSPYQDATTDTELEAYARKFTSTVFHPVGTASMGPKGSSGGVVDSNLIIKNGSGLRVVDASIMPFIPGAHTQASVYIIAERVADLVKKDWGLI